MSFPICSECAKRVLFCPQCQEKYEAGEITPLEVELARAFSQGLPGAQFIAAAKADDEIIILSEKSMLGKIIGRQGMGLKRISSLMGGSKIKVVGNDNLQELAYELVRPAKVEGFSEVYGEGKKHRVKIRGGEKLRMPASVLEKLLSAASGGKVELETD